MKVNKHKSLSYTKNEQLWCVFILLCLFMSAIIAGCVTHSDKKGDQKQLTSANYSSPVPNLLSQNSTYNKSIESLKSEGYGLSGGTMLMTLDKTLIEEQYKTPEGKNATVTSVIRNNTVEEIIVSKDEGIPLSWYAGLFLLFILASLCIWAGYRYYQKRLTQAEEEPAQPAPEPVDVRAETERMLSSAEKAFAEGRSKDGYALAGQALRFFLSHIFGSGKAETNEEIITLIQNTGTDRQAISRMLDLCVMVEFARSEGSSNEFNDIICTIRSVISAHLPPAEREPGE